MSCLLLRFLKRGQVVARHPVSSLLYYAAYCFAGDATYTRRKQFRLSRGGGQHWRKTTQFRRPSTWQWKFRSRLPLQALFPAWSISLPVTQPRSTAICTNIPTAAATSGERALTILLDRRVDPAVGYTMIQA